MTLVLTAITQDHIVQVSDMRLTLPDRSAVAETAAKQVIWNGDFVIGYTGWACSAGERTDQWIATAIASATSVEDALKAIHGSAEAHVRTTGGTDKRLEIFGAGWPVHPTYGRFPYWLHVTNVGGSIRGAPGRFTARGHHVRDELEVHALGQPINLDGLRRTLRTVLSHSTGPASLARILAETIRSKAAVESLVGGNLLIASLPRASVPVSVGWRAGPIDWTLPQCLYAAADPDDAYFRQPTVAGGGMVLFDAVVAIGDSPRPQPWPLPEVSYRCPGSNLGLGMSSE